MSNARVWLVTGSSSGFGLEVVKYALQQGDIVVATLRRPETLSSLTNVYGTDKLLLLKLDITQPQEILDAFAKAKEQYGRIDVVFNNAGVTLIGEFEATSNALAREHFETNFWGPVNVTREAIRFFREENEPGRGGRLIQNSSVHGLASKPASAFYTAGKHALEAVSEALSKDLDPAWNIKISILEPGVFLGTSINKATALVPALSTYEQAPSSVMRGWYTKAVNGDTAQLQSSDIKKAGAIVWKLSLLRSPPLRLPLGKDCIALVKEKLASVTAEINEYEAWSDEV